MLAKSAEMELCLAVEVGHIAGRLSGRNYHLPSILTQRITCVQLPIPEQRKHSAAPSRHMTGMNQILVNKSEVMMTLNYLDINLV
jgi:hypothetical protein